MAAKKKLSSLFAAVSSDLAALQVTPSFSNLIYKAWADPGFNAVLMLRLAIASSSKNSFGKLFAKLLWKRIVKYNACYLSSKAEIGDGFCLPHAVGIVIGDGVKIGNNVTIFQNVTIGRRSQQEKKYPSIGSGVIIYAGACIVGDIAIGNNSIIAANAVVVTNVEPGTIVGGIPARPMRIKRSVHEDFARG
jgi:serine O-acetyltransferase